MLSGCPTATAVFFCVLTQAFGDGKPETHEPAKLVITMPSELKEIVVPFAFRDLPLQ